jgi:hypothetical protein
VCETAREQKKKGPSGKRLAALKSDNTPVASTSKLPDYDPATIDFANRPNICDDFISSLFSSAPTQHMALPDTLPFLADFDIFAGSTDLSSPSSLLPSLSATQDAVLSPSWANRDAWSDGELQQSPYSTPIPDDDLIAALDNFFDKLDPAVSIFDKGDLQQQVLSGAYLLDPALHAMLLVMKAMPMLQAHHGWQPGNVVSSPCLDAELPLRIVQRAQALRSSVDVGEHPSIVGLMGAFLML